MSNLHTQRNAFQTLACWRTWALRDLLFANCNPCNFINVSEENPAVLFSEATFLVSLKKILQAHVSTMTSHILQSPHKCKKAKPHTHCIKLLGYF